MLHPYITDSRTIINIHYLKLKRHWTLMGFLKGELLGIHHHLSIQQVYCFSRLFQLTCSKRYQPIFNTLYYMLHRAYWRHSWNISSYFTLTRVISLIYYIYYVFITILGTLTVVEGYICHPRNRKINEKPSKKGERERRKTDKIWLTL